jgi:small subunit ribosomal protein S6
LKKQNAYESFLVVDSTKSKEQTDEIVSKFRELIKANASSFDGEDIWGRRKLAYQINHTTEGYYVLFYFTSDADFPMELERQYRITDGVIRFLVVRNEDGFKPDLSKSLAPRDGIKPEAKRPAAKEEAPVTEETVVEEAVEAPAADEKQEETKDAE